MMSTLSADPAVPYVEQQFSDIEELRRRPIPPEGFPIRSVHGRKESSGSLRGTDPEWRGSLHDSARRLFSFFGKPAGGGDDTAPFRSSWTILTETASTFRLRCTLRPGRLSEVRRGAMPGQPTFVFADSGSRPRIWKPVPLNPGRQNTGLMPGRIWTSFPALSGGQCRS